MRNELVKLRPPVVLLGLLATATALHLWTPLRNTVHWRHFVTGALMLAAGFFGLGHGQALIRGSGTTIVPSGTPTVFIERGLYRWTRNPIYVSASFLMIGLAFMIGSLPFFAIWVVMFLMLNFIHIPFEEMQMEKQFGDQYRDYKKRVRRWI